MPYLGKISFSEALRLEQQSWARVCQGHAGEVLGFESEPVITLGARGKTEDIADPGPFSILTVERGGQATSMLRANW